MSEAPAYEFVDAGTSHVTFAARGSSLGALFTAAADALLAAVVAEPHAVESRVRCTVALEERDLERLLLRFLNELVYLRETDRLLLRPRRVSVSHEGHCQLQAELAGEAIERDRHELVGEVKAAAARGLRIAHGPDGWEATVTLDT